MVLHLICHVPYSVDSLLYRRENDHDHSEDHLGDQISKVIKYGIYSRCEEIFGHVIHPKEISAECMERTPAKYRNDIADDKSVLFSLEESAYSECGECKEIVTHYLKRGKHI